MSHMLHTWATPPLSVLLSRYIVYINYASIPVEDGEVGLVGQSGESGGTAQTPAVSGSRQRLSDVSCTSQSGCDSPAFPLAQCW